MKTYNRKAIENEYDDASGFNMEYQKVKWGSNEKMYNRFKLALHLIDFKKVDRWLDVGTGTGAFQSIICPLYPEIKVTGIDISSNLIDFATKRNDFEHKNVEFSKQDFLEFRGERFDLITCIGVLQKTNMNLSAFFNHSYKKLNVEGYLFLDTKNIKWNKFKNPDFKPEESHQWFNPADLIREAKNSGFKEIEVNGFIPGKNKIVKQNDSHTIFIKAKKKS